MDETFEKEYIICMNSGVCVRLIDIDNILHGKILPQIPTDSKILYRGWMLNEKQYELLQNRFGLQLITSKHNYLMSHFLPNWYEDIKDITIPSIITNENKACEDFKQFEGKAFLKDYVKSLKTGKGSIVTSNSDIERVIQEMKHYKGFIEGGLILRKFVDLIPESETRYFVIKNVPYSQKAENNKDKLAQEVVKRLENKNLAFYSIDIALLLNGLPIVVEIGDGQVSDYVNWDVNYFTSLLRGLELH